MPAPFSPSPAQPAAQEPGPVAGNGSLATHGPSGGLPLWVFLLRPFVLPFLLLLLVAVAVLVGVGRDTLSRQAVTDSQARLSLISGLSGDISSMENGKRGFIITGDDSYLNLYEDSLASYQANLYALRDLSLPGSQRDTLGRVEELVTQWQQLAADPEIAARRESLEKAAALVSQGVGRDILDEARSLLETVQFNENARLSAATASSAATLNTVRLVTLLGLGLIIPLLLLTVWRVARTVSGSVAEVTRGAQEIAAGEYHLRLPGSPVLELTQLSAQFNGMAGAVQQREQDLQASKAQLERSNRELEQFAYVASHDLQEPLRTISSYTELLARRYQGQLDARADQYIAFTTQATQRMKHLIQDLLAYSRVRRGQASFSSVDTAALVQEVLLDLQTAVRESGAQVQVGKLPHLSGNRELLRHTFQNLLSNALKFHEPDRQPVIQVTATREPGAWVFHVQDNGIGIESAYHEKIFGVFTRLHNMSEYSGSGIGLAVTRSAVEQHGGRVWLSSTPGQGSTFHFSLPDQPAPGTGGNA